MRIIEQPELSLLQAKVLRKRNFKGNFKENYLMYLRNLSLEPSQSSCFKAFCKRTNHLLLSLSILYKAPYKQNSLENVIFNGIAQSSVKICQWDLLKVSTLKGPMNTFFRKAPCS